MGVPLVSIVMPLFNKEKEVGRAIRSALYQTCNNFELIIINDGSTDQGPDIARTIQDDRIRVLDQDNQGVSAARNRGISEAKADLIAFLDADDEWKPDFLETIMMLVRTFPEASVYATSYTIRQINSQERPSLVRGLPERFSEGLLKNYFAVAAHSDPPLWTSAIAVKTDSLKTVGCFPEEVYAGEDLLTWARLAVRCNIAYSALPKAIFYSPVRMEERPPRCPQVPDRVAECLLELLNDPALQIEAKEGLPLYIGLWHRMRAVVFIKLNSRPAARGELLSAIRFSGFSLRLLLLFMLTLLPSRLMAESFHALSRFRSALHNGNS